MFAMRKRTNRNVVGCRIALLFFTIWAASNQLAVAAAEQIAYDGADKNMYPAARETLSAYRSQLTELSGVTLVYVSNQGEIVVRVRKFTPEITRSLPQELDKTPVKVVSVEDVVRRHRHELEMISGADHVISIGVENFRDGQPAIVVRESQPRYEEPMKVPTNIEGIPLRVLVMQDPLVD